MKKELNPHQDWREIAEDNKNMPKCKNCGKEHGNVAFGADHYCKKGYKPIKSLILNKVSQ